MIQELSTLFARDLQKLEDEISAYQNDDNIWAVTGAVKNPAGNLCLHLVGNLNTYIGRNLGKTGYERDRPAEFSLTNVPKEELVSMIRQTRAMVLDVLAKLKPQDLYMTYPENVLGHEMTTGFFLIHLCAHLSWHLGQINYLRRIIES